MSDLVVVRPGVYHDSVTLMRVSRDIGAVPGVEAAIVAMATELNLELAAQLGFEPPEAAPSDLLIAIRAAGGAARDAADEVDRRLAALAEAGRTARSAGEPPHRTTRAAARAHDADIVLVSVPGEHAFAEALDAVEAGMSVMVFSDNVPVEQEILLKDRARERGVLVMGPDCGTACVGGVGLGFANVLRPGPVGVVAASGTGAQQVTCLLDHAGVGVSHVLGVGGRDLSAEVGGRSALRALAALDADPATELIVLISKPPAPEVALTVRAAVQGLATPAVVAMLGPGGDDLTSAAEAALRALGRPVPAWPTWPAQSPAVAAAGAVHGIYSGGTLCAEAALIAQGGSFTDFGADAYTRGRPHPMIDPTARLAALAAVPSGDVALLDVVLGHGADPDPAARLAPEVAGAVRRGVRVVAALVGAQGDPQRPEHQAMTLHQAGAAVFASNAQAARYASGKGLS
ncbi:FdrA family protein [Spongiactinospora sp. TRM90649]|uniref:FdrA family protein n=1 Tax=Spongiactinospora sp. TRM90649 TaxID=3031114 RepID=UPI0023F8E6A0|nr:FdrA family protein [Spongiactinospora sp. TRM90649]MDF5752421.1 FdrA family protein [Spongiactinospora sp. TRM90649]